MDYGALFRTSLRILRQNKRVWLISLFISLFNLYSLIPRNLAVLVFCLSLIFLCLLMGGNLGILLILYHGYLNQKVNLRELWKEIKSYFIRVLGIFILLIVTLAILFILLFLIIRRLPYIFYESSLLIPVYFFGTFLFIYLQLGLIRTKFDIKYAAAVWSYHRGAKLMIALLFTIIQILFNFLLPAVIQKGFSISSLLMNYQEFSAIQTLLIPRILQWLYAWMILPIPTAVIVSLYFMDLEAKEGVPQYSPQAG